MKIAVIFLSLYDAWFSSQAVSTTTTTTTATGQLYSSVAGRDLADDVTRYRRNVRSKLDCALACVQTDNCRMFAVCRRETRTYSKATIAWKKHFTWREIALYNSHSAPKAAMSATESELNCMYMYWS